MQPAFSRPAAIIAEFDPKAFREKQQILAVLRQREEEAEAKGYEADTSARLSTELVGNYSELRFLVLCDCLNEKGLGHVRRMCGLAPASVGA